MLRYFNFTGISPSDMNVNTQNVYSQGIIYKGDMGSIYMNNFTFFDGELASNQIVLNSGEVLIQSLNSFVLEYFTPQNAICVSANQILSPVNTTCETRLRSEKESEQFELSKLFNEVKDSTDVENSNTTSSRNLAQSNSTNSNENTTTTTAKKLCHQVIIACKYEEKFCNNINAHPYFKIKVQSGNIYGNILRSDKYLPNVNYTYRGAIYDEGIDLDDKLNKWIEFERQNEKRVNNMYIIGIGRLQSRVSTYS